MRPPGEPGAWPIAGSRPDARFRIPESRSPLLRRQRLLDLLHGNVDCPLLLVCAPAGYGKTTLLADYARDTEVSVCWYSANEQDQDPFSFIRCLFGAAATRFPRLRDLEGLWSASSAETKRDWRMALGEFVDAIRDHVDDYFILVVDDFHLLTDSPAVVDAADLLARSVPDNCRLIIASREVPELKSLPRLVSESRAASLGVDDLSFTAKEISDVMRLRFGLEISEEEAHRLEQESEGWITSLILTRDRTWQRAGAGSPRALLSSYIAAEMFSQQPPEVQEFLLATSIVDEVTAELCRALAPGSDSARLVGRLEKRSLLVTSLAQSQAWRYHHVLRDFLRRKLRQEAPARFASLHVRAAEHCLRSGQTLQAIHHYLQAQRWDDAAELMEGEAESAHQQGRWDLLGGWLDGLPAGYLSTRPRLVLYQAVVLRLRDQNDEAIRLLGEAVEKAAERGDALLEAQALINRSISLRFKGSHGLAVDDARRALELALVHGSGKDEADARRNLGNAYAHQGKLRKAAREFTAALTGYQRVGDLFLLSQVHDSLGTVHSNLGNLDRAVGHFELARQGWARLGNERLLAITLNNMAVRYCLQGLYELALPLAREAAMLSEACHSVRDQAYALMTLADVERERGEYSSALEVCARALDKARECIEAHLVSYGLAAMGETYRLLGQREVARSHLLEAMSLARDRQQDFELGLAITSLGSLECERGDSREAERLLRRACRTLARTGDRHALARSRWRLANALFLGRRLQEARQQVDIVARVCRRLGYDQFLVHEARAAYALVQFAATQAADRPFFSHLSDRVIAMVPPVQCPLSPAQARPLNPVVEVRTLGRGSVSLNGEPVPAFAASSGRAREMLLFMLFQGGPAHKERIAEALWPEIASSKVNSNFHVTLHRLRKALGPDCLRRNGELYQLNPAWSWRVDAREFEDLLGQAEQLAEEHPRRMALLRSAVELYKDPFLEEMDSTWCEEMRARLEVLYLTALRGLAACHERQGGLREAIALLERFLSLDDLSEETYFRVMDHYINLGDTTSALRVYSRCMSAVGNVVPPPSAHKVVNLLRRLN